jgi:hypothetical protein
MRGSREAPFYDSVVAITALLAALLGLVIGAVMVTGLLDIRAHAHSIRGGMQAFVLLGFPTAPTAIVLGVMGALPDTAPHSK